MGLQCPGAALRRMAGKGHFDGAREPHPRRRPVAGRAERGLGKIELQGQRLHRRVIRGAGILEYSERIARERAAIHR